MKLNTPDILLFAKELFVPYSKDMVADKQIDDKLLLVLGYLRLYCNASGTIYLSLNDLISELGCKLDRGKNRTNSNFRNQLIWLEQNNYIFANRDLVGMTYNSCVKIQINPERNIFDMNDSKSNTIPFVRICLSSFLKITQSDTTVDKGRLLRLYLVIRKYLDESSNTVKYVWPSITTISRDLGISRGTNLCKAIDELEQTGVIYTFCAGSYLDKKGNRKNANSYYSFEPNQFDGAYEHALSYVRNNLGIDIKEFDPKIENPHLKKKADKKKKDNNSNLKSFYDLQNDIVLEDVDNESESERQAKHEEMLNDITDHIGKIHWGESPPKLNEPTQEELEKSDDQYFQDMLDSFPDDDLDELGA